MIEEADGDLMGDGVNIAARLEGIAEPGGICLSEDAYRQVRDRLNADIRRSWRAETQEHRPARCGHTRSGPDRINRPPRRRREAATSAPPRLSIVVLPFANIGGDPEQEYFADGVTESLTTDLSRIAGAFVIARNTAFTSRESRST